MVLADWRLIQSVFAILLIAVVLAVSGTNSRAFILVAVDGRYCFRLRKIAGTKSCGLAVRFRAMGSLTHRWLTLFKLIQVSVLRLALLRDFFLHRLFLCHVNPSSCVL